MVIFQNLFYNIYHLLSGHFQCRSYHVPESSTALGRCQPQQQNQTASGDPARPHRGAATRPRSYRGRPGRGNQRPVDRLLRNHWRGKTRGRSGATEKRCTTCPHQGTAWGFKHLFIFNLFLLSCVA